MNSSMIGKIEKAHRYAKEPEESQLKLWTRSFMVAMTTIQSVSARAAGIVHAMPFPPTLSARVPTSWPCNRCFPGCSRKMIDSVVTFWPWTASRHRPSRRRTRSSYSELTQSGGSCGEVVP